MTCNPSFIKMNIYLLMGIKKEEEVAVFLSFSKMKFRHSSIDSMFVM